MELEPAESVVVCTFALGTPAYFAALRQAVGSALRYTPFDVFAVVGSDCAIRLPATRRFRELRWQVSARQHRSHHFLAKFRALRACLEHTRAEVVLYLDADAVFTRRTSAHDVVMALAGRDLAMVEQELLPDSPSTRDFLFDHYCDHTRVWFGAGGAAPSRDSFRFYNSGVILACRRGLTELCNWALATIERLGPRHEVGQHMIADQDYIQYWANEIHPRCTAALDWSWNHCEHWHSDFPRNGVRIAHLSNACHGPTRRSLWRLRALRASPSIERSWRWLRRSSAAAAGLLRSRAR
jgi:hypothetical protein